MNRMPEFVMGLIGGIFGCGLALLMIIGGWFGSMAIGSETEFLTSAETSFALVAGILLLILSGATIGVSIPAVIRKNRVLSGTVNLITGILGFFLATFVWLTPGILILVSGTLCFRSAESAAAPPDPNPEGEGSPDSSNGKTMKSIKT
ncbi:hypothetical protein C8P63_14011 [Melghirimyces profundicolus]|uniref:DUF4064 domain-containing protein n=1 Tax=Melghirimyces profundicolus TaxID=1242148 RepID=A0A2T6B0K7_9BACL|nr:hypothetical protein [Melghirimyces profundicolus]PTX49616.1 hypothetical protein C8P63_14011 [Melghirimyces profundicolus]